MKKYQIFISSTYDDLKDERRAVTEQILNMGHIPVGMELFQASDDDQWTYICNRLQEMDYYVVIVAERYGSIDPSAGKSFTEKEYLKAVELGIPVVAFLLSDGARASRQWQLVQSERRTEIENFRKLCQSRMTRYWSDGNGLALAVTNALHELFRTKPRSGLVPAADAPGPSVMQELARLSAENHKMQEDLASMRAVARASAGGELQDAIKALTSITARDLFATIDLLAYVKEEQEDSEGDKIARFTAVNMKNDMSFLELLKALVFMNGYQMEISGVTPFIEYMFGRKVHSWVIGKDVPVEPNSHGQAELLAAYERLSLVSTTVEQREVQVPFSMRNEKKKIRVRIYSFTDLARGVISATSDASEILLRGKRRKS